MRSEWDEIERNICNKKRTKQDDNGMWLVGHMITDQALNVEDYTMYMVVINIVRMGWSIF